MKVAAVRETFPGERRVALVPAVVPRLAKAGLETVIESGAGLAAGYTDEAYLAKGAKLAANRAEAFAADIVCQVRTLGANPAEGPADLPFLRPGQVLIGMADPLTAVDAAQTLAERGVTAVCPGIDPADHAGPEHGRALVAWPPWPAIGRCCWRRWRCRKMFPMLMTAAGTLTAGQGVRHRGRRGRVAGDRHRAAARRRGSGLRRAAGRQGADQQPRRQVRRDAARNGAEGAGGYAKQMDEAFYQRQRELMARWWPRATW